MDRHLVPGLTAEDAARAHHEDVKIEQDFGCRTITYWVDEERESAFCLIDAPNIEAVKKLHERAHGLIPNEVIPVNSNVVEAFLGRVSDPHSDRVSDDLKIFNDPAFRIILVTKTLDPQLLLFELGKDKTTELLTLKNDIIREQLFKHEGREVDMDGQGFVLSFMSVNQAMNCAQAIQKSMHVAAELIDLRYGLHAGVPVNNHELLFGKTVNYARYLCSIGKPNQMVISSVVHTLHKKGTTHETSDKLTWLNKTDEDLLEEIVEVLDRNWRDPEFGVDQFCKLLSLSRSNLYRKCTSITGLSPNSLLREHRLLQSLQLMKGSERNIAQTTFDCGFSSPSYFTKCFQKRFGIQPLTYLKAQA